MNARVIQMDRLLLRPTEVAEALAIGRSKAYALIAAGAIPSIRLGGSVRVPVEVLRNWLAREFQAEQELKRGTLESVQ